MPRLSINFYCKSWWYMHPLVTDLSINFDLKIVIKCKLVPWLVHQKVGISKSWYIKNSLLM